MELHPSAQRFQDELQRLGTAAVVRQLDSTTRSAADAAAAVGCSVGQIAKSLIFRGQSSGAAILVITSGANRVDEGAVGERIGEAIGRAEAAFVREATGFAIGGVPPLGHAKRLATYFDEDLLGYATIWAAAGTPNAVFEIDPAELLRLCQAIKIRVKL
ncbi:MAG TPA: YbaK/EbsC family protein [Anaerolineales bacterium]|nr:YbaK/EbsC family protein [Anaerolineales bacterium]